MVSGVTVAQITRPISFAEIPAAAIARCAAMVAKSEVAVRSSAIRRSRMPVRA